MKYLALLLLIASISMPSFAYAQECKAYPPGPKRFACVSARYPQVIEKRDRCKQEAESQGLRPQYNSKGVALRDYVVACMKRGR